MADPDQVRSLYFLGFDVDERLAERLAEHKRSGVAPSQALTLPLALDVPFTADGCTEALRATGKARARRCASSSTPGPSPRSARRWRGSCWPTGRCRRAPGSTPRPSWPDGRPRRSGSRPRALRRKPRPSSRRRGSRPRASTTRRTKQRGRWPPSSSRWWRAWSRRSTVTAWFRRSSSCGAAGSPARRPVWMRHSSHSTSAPPHGATAPSSGSRDLAGPQGLPGCEGGPEAARDRGGALRRGSVGGHRLATRLR